MSIFNRPDNNYTLLSFNVERTGPAFHLVAKFNADTFPYEELTVKLSAIKPEHLETICGEMCSAGVPK